MAWGAVMRPVPCPINTKRTGMSSYSFNFEEVKDTRTSKIEQSKKYENYKNIRHFVLNAAQAELLAMYKWGASDVWFDYQAGERKGRGGKVSSIIFNVYT